jgi:hypothetical protein
MFTSSNSAFLPMRSVMLLACIIGVSPYCSEKSKMYHKSLHERTLLIENDDVVFYFVWAGGNFIASRPFVIITANPESELSDCP